ncbi:uncharacterized protein [Henckelia pumila]|uniref:uncharacterized protein n=1 Tax=Henckelia pumila TaxID=405737 RepID=UPI003C6DEF6E
MASSRGENYAIEEDKHLCRVYIEISQDPIIGRNQNKNQLWSRVAETYNSGKANSMADCSQRSLQTRMQNMNSAVSKLNGCIQQVKYMNPSGASDQDIIDRAKQLMTLDRKYKKGFAFDHVWPLLKDLEKFSNFSQRTQRTSSHSDTVLESPISSDNPELSSFSINLSDENVGGGSSSKRSEGVKKSKLKRKKDEDMSKLVSTIQEENKKLRDLLVNTTTKKEEIINVQKRKVEVSQWHGKNKILMMDVDSISDPRRREFIRKEQEKIMQKREEKQQSGSNNNVDMFGQYLGDFGSSGSGLPDY